MEPAELTELCAGPARLLRGAHGACALSRGGGVHAASPRHADRAAAAYADPPHRHDVGGAASGAAPLARVSHRLLGLADRFAYHSHARVGALRDHLRASGAGGGRGIAGAVWAGATCAATRRKGAPYDCTAPYTPRGRRRGRSRRREPTARERGGEEPADERSLICGRARRPSRR